MFTKISLLKFSKDFTSKLSARFSPSYFFGSKILLISFVSTFSISNGVGSLNRRKGKKARTKREVGQDRARTGEDRTELIRMNAGKGVAGKYVFGDTKKAGRREAGRKEAG